MIFLTRSKRLRNKGWHKVFVLFPRMLECGNEYVVGAAMRKYFVSYRCGDAGTLLDKHMKIEDFNKKNFKRYREDICDGL